MPDLLPPSAALAPSFLSAMADFAAEGRGSPQDDSALGRHLTRFAAQWHTPQGFERFLAELRREGDTSAPPPPDWVHTSTYWWAEGTRFLGSIRIRHELTPRVLESAGHIGYDIAPAARRRGHGTAMLRAALPIAAGMGIEQALITCDVDNVGSRKVIEANGGVLEDERDGKLRFWAPTHVG
ncbi:MAG TPA: GNAT family N-acetyltransferase [Jatrophihabitans sp.]|jgi:predicted acetyltransferase|uniref:GNAT family N-acetyltransferase n=1 Tax=Jatrophihabitans sp. TaxID=1932789 RepID=UPI002EFC29D3